VRADWLFYYAMLEPRYHELLGLGESKEDFERLAVADEKLADREGVQAAGVVLFSEVAAHNRLLERTPTILRHGRGYLWESYDFDSTIDAGDILADPIAAKDHVQAQELICSLRNGLQAYLLADGKGKRLDQAGIQFAQDKRSPLRSVEVESATRCITCHSRGVIAIEDEVRQSARDGLALALRDYEKGDRRKAVQVKDRFFAADLDQIVNADILSFEAAVRATNGLAGAANALQYQRFLVEYERPVTLAALARDTGYPADVLKGVIERSAGAHLDHSVVRLAKTNPRKSTRQQIERNGFGQLMQLLLHVPQKK
jgi:hypothetical protein